MARLFLLVGLPGAGKTTEARRLAAEHRALRLTPDAWMIPLFGESDAGGKRDVLEGRLIALALDALAVGVDVVLDLGLWSRDERSALRWLAASRGASCEVVHLPVSRDVQLQRIRDRWARTPEETYPISEAELDRWREQLEPPDTDELTGGAVPEPPPGWADWAAWAAERWPSSDR
ncbi:AAA family ATPase [Auraticoccus monumenti]|uniref:Predicted kinase n=1 Tax=Auraticoccus monumenti TaxID=675864 RepID=A0A1G7BFP0_9ACTN|nr:ATP-binding protein [Auraticoccus monumenti]SDE25814.1 Predicted kinase [Auraticoccus monumenti]